MELMLLTTIWWRVHPPMAIAFVGELLDLCCTTLGPEVRNGVLYYAKFHTELVVSDYDFLTVTSSSVSVAALMNAFEELELDIKIQNHIMFLRLLKATRMDCQGDEIRQLQVCLREAAVKQPRSGLFSSTVAPKPTDSMFKQRNTDSRLFVCEPSPITVSAPYNS